MYCPFCHIKYNDQINLNYIGEFNICLACDKERADAEAEVYASLEQENNE